MNRSIAVFLAIAFVPAWLMRFVLDWWKPEWGERDVFKLGNIASMMFPALGAYVARRFAEGDRDFRELSIRAPASIYIVVVGLTFAQWTIPAAIALGTKQARLLTTFETTTVIYLLIWLVIPWLFGFGEEFGWRAFLFRRLLNRGPLFAYVVIGIITHYWHWLPPTMRAIQEHTALATPIQLFSLAVSSQIFPVPLILFAVCQSVIAGWLYLRTRDIWLVGAWHGYWHGLREVFPWLALGLAETSLQVIAIGLEVFAAILLLSFGKALRPIEAAKQSEAIARQSL